jgi:hypothetical protein
VLAAAGAVARDDYFHHRYGDAESAWAQGVSDARIGVIGTELQYQYYGDALSNYVQYIGREGAHGAFHDVTTCPSLHRALTDGRYDMVVFLPATVYSQRFPPGADGYAVERWLRATPGVTLMRRTPLSRVYRIDGSTHTSCS